jgi:hypothetical protein
VKNAFLLKRRDMQSLDEATNHDARSRQLKPMNSRTMQIPPGPAFFPGVLLTATIITFAEK